MLNIVPIPALRDNYIWALHNRQHAVVVDPGEAAPVLSWLEARQLKLAAILCTHHHGDHIGGIAGIGEVYNVPVYAPLAENIPGATRQLAEGDTVNLPELDISLAVIDIRGHTRGHIAYLLSFPKFMTVLSSTPSLNPSPAGRGKISPSPSGGRVGKGEILSPIMETSIED